ncbi:MAG TPA: hypothetical protein DDW42_10090 [Desulfobacteraceae bacterium]|nr:hypothetical protein [Desulfobacteraceae bacterium]
MNKGKANDTASAGLLLLLFLLAIHLIKILSGQLVPDTSFCEENVYVQMSGDVASSGVYGFCQTPCLKDLLIRAGGRVPKVEKGLRSIDVLFHSGVKVDVRTDGQKLHIFKDEMSAFYKTTLGIPISLNSETLNGLTAIPGIGFEIASGIIRERDRRGRFMKVDEILSVKGIVPTLYKKICPYLIL